MDKKISLVARGKLATCSFSVNAGKYGKFLQLSRKKGDKWSNFNLYLEDLLVLKSKFSNIEDLFKKE